MKTLSSWILVAAGAVAVMLLLSYCRVTRNLQQTDFHRGWEFSLEGEPFGPVSIPHDWSTAFPFDSVRGEGATGYLLGGKGTYRKSFFSPASGVSVLHFDGVYNNARILVNGREVGTHPYGYSPFYYELDDYLRPPGEENELLVEVDHSRYADSRWYTGSGIYRSVRLHNFPATHIPVWGTFVTTPEVSDREAKVSVETSIRTRGAAAQDAELRTEIRDPDGRVVATARTPLSNDGNTERKMVQVLAVAAPRLWNLDDPNLYRAVTRLVAEDRVLQETTTPFGIRTFQFDPDTGFSLNGKSMKIKGVCLHHDGGLTGAAVPKAVWRRRLRTLKDGGCNAIRSAHNPASDELLDLCDEMGLLVQDEFFDEWDYPKDKRLNMGESESTDYITRGYTEHFQEWAERDLKNTVRAHRNHPSIIQWSIGNEIEWTYPSQREVTGFFGADSNGNYFWNEPPYDDAKIRALQKTVKTRDHKIGETARKLADWTREVDPTRPVTANCILPSASYTSGYADALDVIGFSYRRVMYDYGHRNYPDKPLMGTENLVQWHEWKAIEERDHVAGTFLWTGIDYLGESNEGWPKKNSTSGMLDLAGFPKPSYYMMKSLWTEEPMLYVTTQVEDASIFRATADGSVVARNPDGWKQALWSWHDVNRHWNYPAGHTVIVEALSNCPEAELFTDGQSLGRLRLADFPDRIYKWAVPSGSEHLLVKGYSGIRTVDCELTRAGEPVELQLKTVGSGEEGFVQVVAQLTDANGRPVRHIERPLTFSVAGEARLVGVDNGAAANTAAFQGGTVTTAHGRALAVLRQTGGTGGIASLTVTTPGLPDITLDLPQPDDFNAR